MSRITTAKAIEWLTENNIPSTTDESGTTTYLIPNGAYATAKVAFEEYRAASTRGIAKPKAAHIRVDPEVTRLVREMGQYLSSGGEKQRVWGDKEVSIDRLKNMVIAGMLAYANVEVEPKMVANAINTMKRKGEIALSRKGYFRATDESKIDLSIFFS